MKVTEQMMYPSKIPLFTAGIGFVFGASLIFQNDVIPGVMLMYFAASYGWFQYQVVQGAAIMRRMFASLQQKEKQNGNGQQ